MMTKNPMQLKAFIKNKAAEKHISAQLVMQNYMLERLLERISLSPYKNNFILKGGFLISAIVGLDTRATMDLDTTIKGFTLTHEAIRKIFTEICAVQIADDVQFEVVGISDIRETDDYPGIRVALKANYPPISVPLTVDVTTGDMITPREVEYTFSLLFDDRTISILAYNLETVLAEKLETVLSRNIANTRPRDYYDVHILYALRGAECDRATLRRALERTTQKRGSGMILTDYPEIMKEIRESDTLRKLWEKYSREYEYAKDIVIPFRQLWTQSWCKRKGGFFMGWLAAQGAIMAIGLFIGLVCSVIGLFFGHIILFDSIALGIAAGVCCNQFTAIHPALCLVIGVATFLLLLWLQNTSIGFWLVGGLLTLIYAAVFGLLAYFISEHDPIWDWVIFALVFLVVGALHLRARDN